MGGRFKHTRLLNCRVLIVMNSCTCDNSSILRTQLIGVLVFVEEVLKPLSIKLLASILLLCDLRLFGRYKAIPNARHGKLEVLFGAIFRTVLGRCCWVRAALNNVLSVHFLRRHFGICLRRK
jgi:hypothetical protein